MAGVPDKLYHYTSKDNADAITKSGVIKAQDDPKHSRFGPGVYLSDMPPSRSDKDIVSANWGGQARPEKTETAIEVNARSVNAVKCQEDNRTVYKVTGDVRLGSDSRRVDRK